MNVNRDIENKETPPKEGAGGRAIFSGVGRIEDVFEKGIPIKYMPKILFTTGLLVLYIMNSYLIAKKEMRIQKTKALIEDLRTDYTTMKADYMFSSKQSEVAKRVKSMGLKEDGKAPVIIEIKTKEK